MARQKSSNINIDELREQIKQELYQEVKNQILEELKNEQELQRAIEEQRREEEKKKHEEYVKKMLESPDPWVDITGWHEEPNGGARIELEWNSAFIKMLRENGYTGINDEELVQKWIINVLYDIVHEEEEPQKATTSKKKSNYE